MSALACIFRISFFIFWNHPVLGSSREEVCCWATDRWFRYMYDCIRCTYAQRCHYGCTCSSNRRSSLRTVWNARSCRRWSSSNIASSSRRRRTASARGLVHSPTISKTIRNRVFSIDFQTIENRDDSWSQELLYICVFECILYAFCWKCMDHAMIQYIVWDRLSKSGSWIIDNGQY